MTTVESRTMSPPRPAAVFENLRREHGFEPVRVEGEIPRRLAGTLYRNGAGILEQFGRRYDHVFESDGAISALRIEAGEAFAAARVVRSEGLVQERRAGRHLASYAARWPARIRRIHGGGLKNTANTHVVPWRDELWALMEGGKPTRIDPRTLETLGETDLEGVIGGSFSAHPHRVAKRRTLYNFGMSYGAQTWIDLYALPDDGAARRMGRVPLAHPVMLHDFIVTGDHLVFFISPIRVLVWRMMMGLRSFTDNLRWTPSDGSEVIVVPIDEPENITRFHTEPFCCFHFASGFEQGDQIVVDYIRYPDSRMLGSLGDGTRLTWTDRSTHVHGMLHRARIDLRAKTLHSEPLWDGACEYPRLAPSGEGARPQTLWMQSARYVDDVLRFAVTRVEPTGEVRDRVRVQHHRLDAGQLSSESVFVPDPEGGEDEGSLLTLVFDSYTERSHVLVLDARTLVFQARVLLEQAIPLTFHGSWVPS